jgi:hypothetical protein
LAYLVSEQLEILQVPMGTSPPDFLHVVGDKGKSHLRVDWALDSLSHVVKTVESMFIIKRIAIISACKTAEL